MPAFRDLPRQQEARDAARAAAVAEIDAARPDIVAEAQTLHTADAEACTLSAPPGGGPVVAVVMPSA